MAKHNEDIGIIIARSWGANDLRQRQTALTKTINTLQEQAKWFRGFASKKELEQIESAIATFTRLRDQVRHAKEIQVRKDKRHEQAKKAAEASIAKHLLNLQKDTKNRYLMAFYEELDCMPKEMQYIHKLVDEHQSPTMLRRKLQNIAHNFINSHARYWCTDFVTHEDYQDVRPAKPLTKEAVLALFLEKVSSLPSEAKLIAEQLDEQLAQMEAIESADNVKAVNFKNRNAR